MLTAFEEKILLPGMFARIRVVQAVKEDVVTVPQRAVTRVQGGMGSVLVVDERGMLVGAVNTNDLMRAKVI